MHFMVIKIFRCIFMERKVEVKYSVNWVTERGNHEIDNTFNYYFLKHRYSV